MWFICALEDLRNFIRVDPAIPREFPKNGTYFIVFIEEYTWKI